jgi:hypothetical protein
MTSRAAVAVATHRNVWHDGASTLDLILDHAAWAGGSGSPVYLSDGRVVGILLARGTDEGAGVALVRPSEALRAIVGER